MSHASFNYKSVQNSGSVTVGTHWSCAFQVSLCDGVRQVCHRGNFSKGHYWSFNCRVIDGSRQWFKCDDSKVDKVKTDEVLKSRKEVYLLLYSRDAAD